MNGVTQTRIFGLRIGLDPKFIVLGLIAIAALLFWYNSRSDEENPSRPSVSTSSPEAIPQGMSATRTPGSALAGGGIASGAGARRAQRTNDRSTLRLRAVDPTHGDIDPTLRLDLLAHLQSIEEGGNSRNLFEMGAAPEMTDAQGRPIKHTIIPTPIPRPPVVPSSTSDAMADVNIPLKYYGFAKQLGKPQSNRGFFLDGDNILVASEGELVKQRYLVVELTATSARVEDTQVKKGKTLPIVPENREASVAQPSPDE